MHRRAIIPLSDAECGQNNGTVEITPVGQD